MTKKTALEAARAGYLANRAARDNAKARNDFARRVHEARQTAALKAFNEYLFSKIETNRAAGMERGEAVAEAFGLRDQIEAAAKKLGR